MGGVLPSTHSQEGISDEPLKNVGLRRVFQKAMHEPNTARPEHRVVWVFQLAHEPVGVLLKPRANAPVIKRGYMRAAGKAAAQGRAGRGSSREG